MDPDSMSSWTVMEGFNIESVSFDFMHNVYLGTARDLLGSGIRLFIRQKLYTCDEGICDKLLAEIQNDMIKDCREYGFLKCISRRTFMFTSRYWLYGVCSTVCGCQGGGFETLEYVEVVFAPKAGLECGELGLRVPGDQHEIQSLAR